MMEGQSPNRPRRNRHAQVAALALAILTLIAVPLALAQTGTRHPSATAGAAGAPRLTVPAGFAPIEQFGRLVRDYRFSGSRLPTDWSVGTHNYGYKATLFQPSQVRMTGSTVALTASHAGSGGYPYRSGWITTAGRFTLDHGLIDFRAKMPRGQGLWSGLWAVNAQGSNPQAEIDVQEMLLGDTHTIYGSLHEWSPFKWGETQRTRIGSDTSRTFHDYQLVWQHDAITWAVDGRVYAQYTRAQALSTGRPWPFDYAHGVYLIANLAVAAPTEGAGVPSRSTAFPAAMQVQSVRIWQ
jgi:beta-glucanase (GH16 family)